jgi:tRNA dimethylallyltransferase
VTRKSDATDPKTRIIIICGPTGVGKSELAMKLVREFGGEIISADSMQVYRYMDIGTAKPTVEERALVRHHLIDVVNPDQNFNAALYAEKARRIIEDLRSEQKTAWIVGGTGLYIKALTAGLVEGPGTREDLREEYRETVKQHGTGRLYERLRAADAEAAARIHPHDAVRIMRALEVIEGSGESLSSLQKKHRFGDRPYSCLKIGIGGDRPTLYEKIDRRCDEMMEKGLVREVEYLLSHGYGQDLKPMQSLGYKHILRFLKEAIPLGDALFLMKRDTRNYAKRQLTWFRADGEIRWFSAGEAVEIRKKIARFLSGSIDFEMS